MDSTATVNDYAYLTDPNYQYYDKEEARIAKATLDYLKAEGRTVQENFFIGGVISNDVVGGVPFDNSALEEDLAIIMSKGLEGKQVTLAFPNCNKGHWRLFLMQFDPAKPEEAVFTIADSLCNDPDKIETIFHDNIAPIFESKGLSDAFGVTAATHCGMLDFGLQKTGIDGTKASADMAGAENADGNNTLDCAPRMNCALRLCAEYGVDNLKDEDFVEAVFAREEFPLPALFRQVGGVIEKLQNQRTELLIKSFGLVRFMVD